MPKEGYITRQNLNDYKNPALKEMEENQSESLKQSEEWIAYNKMQTDTDTLTRNRRTSYFSSKAKEDSAYMQNVKTSLSNISNFYMDQVVPASKEGFEQQLAELKSLYEVLKNHCTVYLDKKKGGWKRIYKGEGYYRYQMVQNALTKASVEMAVIENRARLVFDECQDVEEEAERPLWVNVLAEARTKHLDLGKNNGGKVERTGGNCNSVIKLTTKSGEVAYIKEKEVNLPPDALTEQFTDTLLHSPLGQNAVEAGFPEGQIAAFIKLMCDAFKTNGFFRRTFFDNESFEAVDFEQPGIQKLVLDKIAFSDIKTDYNFYEFFQTKHAMKIAGEYGEYYFRHDKSYAIATTMAQMDANANITSRNVATYRLAELLGVPELVPTSRNVKYKDENGISHQGILMAEAKGDELHNANLKIYNSMVDANSREHLHFADNTYLQMNSLQILDVIAGQVDRHASNIMAEQKGGRFIGIKGIDNDMCFGKLTYEFIKKLNRGQHKLKPIEDEKGVCKLRVIDSRLRDRLLTLTDEMVTYVFADLLSKEELQALLNRIHGVQNLLKNIKEKDEVYFREPNDVSYTMANKTKSKQINCYTKLMQNEYNS